ncbi:hypothetical protein ABID39_001534 [Bartonella japonica]|uniref:Uncharacterized protein n=1 Tax=Bartonella japonica TaxID=357761 RepID=A0ABV2FQL4_9HYPH
MENLKQKPNEEKIISFFMNNSLGKTDAVKRR